MIICFLVQGDKVRRRDDWKKWVPSSSQFPTDSGSKIPNEQTDSTLSTSIEKIQLDDATANQISTLDVVEEAHTEVASGGSSSNEVTAQSKLANGEDSTERSHT